MTPPPLTPSRITQLRIGVALRRRVARLKAHDELDASGRAAWRADRLAELWHHAVVHSSHYRDLGARGPGSGRVDLADLPVLDKADLVHRFDALVTVDGLRRTDLEDRLTGRPIHGRTVADRFRMAISSGSSGSPAILAFDAREWVELIANAARARATSGPRPRGVVRSAKIGSPSRWHLSTQVPATLSDPRKPSLSLSAAEPSEKMAAALNPWAPTILSAYPSALRRLMSIEGAGALDIAPLQVFASGEHLDAATRAKARAVWGVEIFDQYVATEVGFIAVQCPAHDGYHVLDDHVLVEVVDERGAPCDPGQEGQVLVTALHSRTLPIIRYRIGDRATLAEGPCSCGHAGPRLASIDGANREVLTFRARSTTPDGGADGDNANSAGGAGPVVPTSAGGDDPVATDSTGTAGPLAPSSTGSGDFIHVHPVAITAIVDALPIGSWIVYHSPEAMRMEVTAPAGDFDPAELRRRLSGVLDAAGAHPDVEVQVEVVPTIEAGPGGKAARFRPLDHA